MTKRITGMRNDFEVKYEKEIAAISAANKVDLSVATDMFISTIKGHFGLKYRIGTGENVKYLVWDKYDGVSENLNYDEAMYDYLELVRG